MSPRCDPEAVAEAERLQEAAPGWLIIWRPWRQCFTAFEGRDPDQVRILEADTMTSCAAPCSSSNLNSGRPCPAPWPTSSHPTWSVFGSARPHPAAPGTADPWKGKFWRVGTYPGVRSHLVRPYVGR